MASNGTKRMALGNVTQGKAKGKQLASELDAAFNSMPKQPTSKKKYGKNK